MWIHFLLESEGPISKVVANTKNIFFSSTVVHEICVKVINEYFVLTERDLSFWDADPEAYGIITIQSKEFEL